MIKLKTDCDICMHKRICRFVHNAKNDMEKLKDTQYGNSPSTDYDWDYMAKYRNVDIFFSCPNFQVNTVKKGEKND